MSWYEKTFEEGSIEIGKLRFAAYLMENKSPNHWQYMVSDTYRDFGQNWMWTTIIQMGSGSTVQALTPTMQKEILSSETFEEVEKVVERYFADKYCGDKQTKTNNPDYHWDGSFDESALPYLGW